jgi:hypothetical protein
MFPKRLKFWDTHTSNVNQQVDRFVADLLLEGFNVSYRGHVQLHSLASQLFDWTIGVDVGCNDVVSLCDCHWSEHGLELPNLVVLTSWTRMRANALPIPEFAPVTTAVGIFK